jgi:hypothetical protein
MGRGLPSPSLSTGFSGTCAACPDRDERRLIFSVNAVKQCVG